ncbi:hypothetical protein KFZ56_05080 [Virgibacillus sp. NKC19-3]|uniref:condensation domain-containing protein n=1 Tax=Virgibacillus saliphilus TaxID=2831674 RepID=UPI001C9AE9FD|nr:condensation domain-containing protein [Virgibacillus sp. NKC19-3]MBY7142461.1 hypothetical protein [Virgibacillus sp. NKC19-3]
MDINLIYEKINKLSEDKRNFFFQNLKKEALKYVEIANRNVDKNEVIPLSFIQEQIWFLEQFSDETEYNMSLGVKIKGTLNYDAISKSIFGIIQRHKILRTNFHINDTLSFPFQEVNEFDEDKVELVNVDLKRYGQEEVEMMISNLSNIKFNLSNDSLIKFYLLKTRTDEHILLLVTHHLLFDFGSIEIFIRQLTENYIRISENKPISQDGNKQYFDFVHNQRNELGEGFQEKINYWKDILKEPLPTINFPIRKFNNKSDSRKEFLIEKELLKNFKDFCMENNITVFVGLLSVFKLSLHLISKNRDIIVGVPMSNRNRKEFDNLIGCFIDTIVTRTQIEYKQSVNSFLKKLNSQHVNAITNSLPYRKILETVNPRRKENTFPIFQVMFNYLNSNNNTIKAPSELTIEPFVNLNNSAKFILSMDLIEGENEIFGSVEHSSSIDSTIAKNVASNFQYLVKAMVKSTDLNIGELIDERNSVSDMNKIMEEESLFSFD